MNKGKLTFAEMLDLEAREEGLSGSDWRSGDSDSTEVDSDGNLRDFVCKDDDAEEPLLTPGSRTSTSSDGSYRDEQARIEGHGARGRTSARRPRRPFHPYVFASYLKSAIPVVDDFVRSLKSFRNEMDLCDGVVQDRAADANTAGSARCPETGAEGQGSPGADTKRGGEAAEDTDSEPPFLRSRPMTPIDEALAFLKSSDVINYAATARRFNCDETTLRRRHQGKQRSRRDADRLYKSRLSKQQERDLIAYIHKLSSRGIPPTLSMIKNFAQDIAKTEVGKDWPYRFVQRYRDELGCTWFDGLDMSRKRADNASRYKAYFELIRTKIEQYNILPCNTYNVDEKGFLLGVINRTKRVFALSVKKQGKLLGAAQDGNRSWITFLACVCQDLSALPPFLIYQGKPGQVQDTWLTEFDPEHQSAFFTTSETGWTSHQRGKEWLTGVFDRFTKAKARNGRDYRLLITDGHSSHVNMDFLEWCDQHRIIVAVFPPHSTHRLQPLDVSLFSPLSTAYSNQLIQWTAKTQGLVGLSKREFWTLFWNAFEASFTPENVASGWKRTGLLPFDPEVVLSQIIEKGEDDSDTGGDSAESLALQQPSARDLRRLVDKVADKSAADADRNSRRLKSTLESLQSEVELLRYENRGLRETIIHERQRRQRGKALKDYLFDRTDPNSAQVFSPAKVAQARLRKAALESQKKEEALQKETQKVQRQQKAAERRALTLERRRQREAEMERKRQMKEARQQEKETNRRVRQELKRHCQETAQEMQDERQVASETRKKSPGVQDEIIVASQPTPEPPVASQAPDLLHDNTKEKARLPRHRLGLRRRVLVDLTCRHSSRTTEIIDLTGDETGYRQPQQANNLDAVVKMASDIDTSASNEGQANPAGLYCAACNGTIGAQPVLRICGCLYCKACNANAARRWNRQDFACNIYQHWRQGNHVGRETFGLDEECSICFEAFVTGQIQCLPCGHVFHERCLVRCNSRANDCPHCRQRHGKDATWTVGALNLQSGRKGTARTGREAWWLRTPKGSTQQGNGRELPTPNV
ncbi:DDE superfamily endonuclease, CENP-B-like protein [Purpureocillium lavendulum]|uniref:DDE superfamily endonuclease, CENP-B-like protein n=1 Tax=Purpureocillium lavendulum TaxID=1247861 RepID=A0AB34FEL0_9HYPO|nr:DDE superfamily endonuclease, CENP-B-like protein [Purpureocillium lavendulum]